MTPKTSKKSKVTKRKKVYIKSNEITKIHIPKECRYCGHEVVYVSNEEIYGKLYGKLYKGGNCYLCRTCGAFVGVHPETNIPLGTLANKELRKARTVAHRALDTLWEGDTRIMTRNNAYKWLAFELGLTAEETHIGLFEIDQCFKVIELVELKWNNKEERK